MFGNPAAVWMLDKSYGYFYYTKPSIVETKEGGRSWSVGVYDGENAAVKGGIGYSRTSRTRIRSGSSAYEDRSEIRTAMGLPLNGEVLGGVNVRYVTSRIVGQETKFFQGDAGVIFPLFKDMRGGITYENAVEKAGEKPRALGAGLRYGMGYGIQLSADGARILKGALKGERGWALAAETTIAGDLVIRAGRFFDASAQSKGWSLGASWASPRATFDYAMRTAKGRPHERDHVFGILIQL